MKKYCIDRAGEMSIKEIVEDFRAHGFKVTEEAVGHNMEAHYDDFKSGYLDEDNGYFLFTPCCCNSLSFYAEELNGKDYQKTYKA